MTGVPAALLLVVDDERPIRRFVVAALEADGYRVLEADCARDALILTRSHRPDLVILDLGLPDMDGLQVIDQLRMDGPIPIVVLSARDHERDKVLALDRGADDYLSKPFGVEELRARVRVALRHHARAVGPTAPARFEVGELRVDLDARRVQLAGHDLRLTATQYRLLAALVKHAGKVLTHHHLLREVWGPGRTDEPHLVRVHMANLRRKLEADTTRPRYILTELGVGYRLVTD